MSEEARIASLVHDWFGLLEARAPESLSLDDFLAAPSFEFSGADGRVLSRTEFRDRLAEIGSAYEKIEYRIDEVRIAAAGKDLYQARFEFERRAVDASGTPHVARAEHNWLVRAGADGAPVILRIDERPMLAFPGTGPQIVCY